MCIHILYFNATRKTNEENVEFPSEYICIYDPQIHAYISYIYID